MLRRVRHSAAGEAGGGVEGELEGGGRSSSGHAVMFSHAALMWLDELKHVTSNTSNTSFSVQPSIIRHILHTVMSSAGVRGVVRTPPVAATGLVGFVIGPVSCSL